jgi:hypothetical protein
MDNVWVIYLTIIVLACWIIFPVGMFLSVSHVDKNTDQLIRLEKLRHQSVVRTPHRQSKEQRWQQSRHWVFGRRMIKD